MDKICKEKFVFIGYQELNNGESDVAAARINWKYSLKRFLSNKLAVISLILLIIIVAASICGPSFTSYKPEDVKRGLRNILPGNTHIFGTDYLGRDIFIRVCAATRTSLLIGSISATINIIIGIIFGAICVYYDGITDEIIMRIVEILTSIPSILFIIQILLVIRIGIVSLIIALSLIGWCNVSRIIRGQLLQVKQQEYILAAQALGASTSRIIAKHFLVNVLSMIIVTFALEIPNIILTEASLSFIGFGLPEPFISFGTLAIEAEQNIMFYPYQALFPGMILSLTLICINLIADGLSDALDYRIDLEGVIYE